MSMKAQIFPLFAICGILAGLGPMTSAASVGVTATANPAAPAFSGRIDDVVKLSHSGVDESIVMSYIKTSPGPFQPDADEIIKLRDSGVLPQVITALLQRSAELREQGVGTASSPAQPAPSYAQQNTDSQYSTPQPAVA